MIKNILLQANYKVSGDRYKPNIRIPIGNNIPREQRSKVVIRPYQRNLRFTSAIILFLPCYNPYNVMYGFIVFGKSINVKFCYIITVTTITAH